MKFSTYSTAAFISLAMFASPSYAAKSLETVVVFGEKDARQLNETTSSADVVGKDLLDSPRIEHTQQLFQTVPGVWVSRGSGQEHLTAIRSPVFTGAGGCGAFGMTEDGIALRANSFCNANQLFDSHYEVAQHVEVYKGPHTSMVGGNAQFGGINVSLPKAREVENQVRLRGNSRGYRGFSGQASAEGDRHAVAGLLSLTEDDGFRDQSGFKQQKLSLKHNWQTDTWNSVESGLSLMNLEQETAGYVNGKDAYKDKTLSEQNQNPEAYRDAKSLRLYSRFQRRDLDREWVFTPYMRSNDMAFLMHFVPWQPVEENGHDSLGWQLQWSRFLPRGSKVFWGQELEQTWANLSEIQYQPSPTLPAQIPVGVHYDYHVAAQNAALYGGLWQATGSLGLDASVRVDYVRFDYDNNAADGSACADGVRCRFYRPASRVDTFFEPSAHVGAIYQLQDQLYGFGRLALSFRAPQAAELYRAQADIVADIDAEQTQSVELGLRGEHQLWLFELALYAMENQDGIIQDSERRYVNGVDSRHQGLEYEVQYGEEGEWTVALGGQLASHTYRNNPPLLGSSSGAELDGLEMDTAPKHETNLQLQWWPSAALRLSAQWHRLGKYYLDPESTFTYEGHNLLDLDSSWDINTQLQLQVSVLNLLDRRYAERADSAFGNYQYFPGLERRLALALSYRF